MFCSILSVFMWKNFKRLLQFKITLLLILTISVGYLYLITLIKPGSTTYNAGHNVVKNRDGGQRLINEYSAGERGRIVYAPNTTDYTNIMEETCLKLNTSHGNLMGFHNLTELEKHQHLIENGFQTIVVIFNNSESKISNTLKYTIRKKIRAGTLFHNSSRTKYSEALQDFQAIDTAIGKSFMELVVNNTLNSLPRLTSTQQHLLLNRQSSSHVILEYFTVVIFLSHFMLTVSLLLNAIVEEKQDGIKEILTIATSYSYLNQTAMFILVFLIALLMTLGQCGYAVYYKIFDCTNIIFPLVLIVLFVCALMSYTYFVSAFFDSVTYSSTIGSTIYIIPFLIWNWTTTPLLLWFKWLSPIKMFFEGMEIFAKYENHKRCFTLNDLQAKEPASNAHSLLEIYIIFVGTSCFYIFLYYYLSSVFPGKFGTPRPTFFVCVPSFWSSNKLDKTTASSISAANDVAPSNSIICKVQNLSKSFKKSLFSDPFIAVKNSSFEIPNKRVTVLLGHNGAGKTTTMSMIAGILPPTTGSISLDNESDVNIYRSCIGFCPEYDVFISYLNCRDHLFLFGRLRGLTKKQANINADVILEKVRLTSKANKSAKTLSHGMKRRLCLACAIIGKTKLIILDEPSSGLDPESRRDLWDVILPLRKERALLLTTHSMEEADVLGDKIIIMDHGNIVCDGTQMSLKRQYGSGYRLKILMAANFKKKATLKLITKTVANASVKSETPPMLMISLPYEDMSKFSNMLKDLETKKDKLGIESISLCHSTMEEVFLNSATTFIDPLAEANSGKLDTKHIDQKKETKKSKCLLLNQFIAIFYKKFIFIRRSWIKYLIHFLFPFVSVLLMYWYAYEQQNDTTGQPQNFELTANKLSSPYIILVLNQTNVKDKLSELASKFKLNSVVMNNNKIHVMPNGRIDKIGVNGTKSLVTILYQNNVIIGQPMIHFGNNHIHRMLDLRSKIALLDYSMAQEFTSSNTRYAFAALIPSGLPIGLFFYIFVYMGLPHIEEVTEFRIIQRISPWLFWFTTYVFDIMCHTLLSTSLIVLISVCCGNLLERRAIINTYLTILVIGIAYIPIIYVIAKLFKKLTTAYATLFYGCFVCWAISSFISSANVKLFPKTYYIFKFLPEFAIRFQLTQSVLVYSSNPEEFNVSYLLELYIGESLVLLLIIICIFENIYISTAINNCIARINPIRCIRKARQNENEATTQPATPPDQYVEQERELVKAAITATNLKPYTLIASQLKKNYIDFPAVKGISFTVKQGECFGLLGMNGAGKTTSFKMMTLNTSISDGDIYINGFHARKQKIQYHQEFGYCPEVNALIGCMTSFELLKYMALLKGTRCSHVNDEVCEWISKMDLSKFKEKPSYSYSGGTKRKLNTAISMISDPNLIFLDEPTSGVDPISRRFMWKCIRDFQQNKQTVVLTSHSMDECEELCNRLAIMVKGEFKCIGNIQKLKLIFGTGFTLLLKVHETALPEEIDKIKTEIGTLFQCSLRDDYAGTLVYKVAEDNIEWSSIFGKVFDFSQKNSSIVEDFAINEISLEDIFLQFRTERMEPAATVINIETNNL